MSLWMEGGAVCENPYAKEQGLLLKNCKVGAQFRRNCKILSLLSSLTYVPFCNELKLKRLLPCICVGACLVLNPLQGSFNICVANLSVGSMR